MKGIKALSVAAMIGLFLLLASCQTAGGKISQSVTMGSPDDPISLTVLSYQDVRAQYGPNFMINPFMAPSSTIMPTYNDYIVLKLNFNTAAKVPVMVLRAEVTDERGKVYAAYMTRDKFAEFAMQQSPDMASNTEKRNKIDWYYLPNPIMNVDAGKRSYVLVLVGRHPIPDTATIHVAVSVNNVASSWDVPVPISND